MKAEEEDVRMEKEGEDKDSFIARLCVPALKSVNKDLTFTAEVASDFENKRLTTVDFKIKKDGELEHSYFENSIKHK